MSDELCRSWISPSSSRSIVMPGALDVRRTRLAKKLSHLVLTYAIK